MKIINKKEADTLSVRVTISIKEMQQTLASIYTEIAGLLGKDGIKGSGAPFVIYYNMDMDNLDIEVGFPTEGAARDYGRVKRSKLPGGEQAYAEHLGPYDRLNETYTKLTAFCKEQNRVPEEYMYEEYLNEPGEVSTEELLTNIYFILK